MSIFIHKACNFPNKMNPQHWRKKGCIHSLWLSYLAQTMDVKSSLYIILSFINMHIRAWYNKERPCTKLSLQYMVVLFHTPILLFPYSTSHIYIILYSVCISIHFVYILLHILLRIYSASYSALHPNPLHISVLIHRQLLHNKLNLFVIGADISFFGIYRYICAGF